MTTNEKEVIQIEAGRSEPRPTAPVAPPTASASVVGAAEMLPDDIAEVAEFDGPIACAELFLRMTTLGCPEVDDGSLADGLRDARAQIIAYGDLRAAAMQQDRDMWQHSCYSARDERDAETKRADALQARLKELQADADRWRQVCDKAWFVDAASFVYGIRRYSFDPTCDDSDVIEHIDAEILAERGETDTGDGEPTNGT